MLLHFLCLWNFPYGSALLSSDPSIMPVLVQKRDGELVSGRNGPTASKRGAYGLSL